MHGSAWTIGKLPDGGATSFDFAAVVDDGEDEEDDEDADANDDADDAVAVVFV